MGREINSILAASHSIATPSPLHHHSITTPLHLLPLIALRGGECY